MLLLMPLQPDQRKEVVTQLCLDAAEVASSLSNDFHKLSDVALSKQPGVEKASVLSLQKNLQCLQEISKLLIKHVST